MGWSHLRVFSGWAKASPVQVGRDADGDLGIMDADGYSIVIRKDQAVELANHIIKIYTQPQGGKD